jgi:uncharacterized protein (DUF1810 family)
LLGIMSLERFKIAQDSPRSGFATALAELRSGRKTSHWIWYVFPQLAGLGRSWTAQKYAIRDLDEAIEYLRDAELRDRLARATAVVAGQLGAGTPLADLMGGTLDAMKLVSSLTLFEIAAGEMAVLEQLSPGEESGAAPVDVTLATNAPGRVPPTSRLSGGRFAEDCRRVLDLAAAQGFPRCAYTQAHARR